MSTVLTRPPVTAAELRALIGRVPRVRLAHTPTPLEAMPRLTAQLAGPRILVKRDDLTRLAFGGHKVRNLEMRGGAGFAMLSRGELRLLLNTPGGWNRIMIELDDLAAAVESLRASGARFRNAVVVGPRRQADPSGGPVRQRDRAVRAAPLMGKKGKSPAPSGAGPFC